MQLYTKYFTVVLCNKQCKLVLKILFMVIESVVKNCMLRRALYVLILPISAMQSIAFRMPIFADVKVKFELLRTWEKSKVTSFVKLVR